MNTTQRQPCGTIEQMPQFDGKVAIITGGTSGIGAATVRRMSQLGANILFTGRRLERADKIPVVFMCPSTTKTRQHED